MEPTPEALRAIEVAIEIEKDGLAFYTQAARQTDDPHGRRMFETLAADEAAHLALFEHTRAELLKGGSWPSPEEVAARSPRRPVIPPIFPPNREQRATQAPQRELEALRRGIQAEEDSIAHYTQAAEKTSEPAGRAMYIYLAEQEKGHRAILEAEYDHLTQTGFWFDIREFDLETAG